ncbi:peptidyl-dipeptidase Dcp [Actinomycetes bacterium]|nr:peptidyl-dipeptidase Dcp [Actinomycetes bacterium]
MANNPFFERSTLPFELPPFSEIKDEHYLPAFYEGTKIQLAEVTTIIDSAEPTTFENTIVALEKSGQLLGRMLNVFYNKSSSDTSDLIDEIEAEIAPKLAAHSDAIQLNPKLFAKIKSLHENCGSLNLNSEDSWLLEKYYRDLVHAGAHLSDEERLQLTGINEELSKLQTAFGKNLLNDTNDLAVMVENLADLDGLTAAEIATASNAAKDRGHEGKYLLAMVNFTGNPLLTTLKNRELRKKIMDASLVKGNRNNDKDTKAILLQMVRLRARRAKLFGVSSHAEYVIQEQTAGSPANVHKVLREIAPAAVKNARDEGAQLQEAIFSDGHEFELASWDWEMYSEKVRLAKHNVDTAAMRPYFELERVLHDGVFFAATKLFGITFKECKDLITYHPEARAFEVKNEDGSPLGLYVGDFFTRDSKRGGAWMNSLVRQNTLLGQLPVVVNNLNIPKPPKGEPALLTLDFTTTLFHEFGHALHGLLSQVKYPRVSGTSVQRDFVEFPSQVNEMWILWPEVVKNYARHYQTGEQMPQNWIDNLQAAATFNEGFATTSYLAAAILDLAWHSLTEADAVDNVSEFERQAIADYGLDYPPVHTRYRSTYFSHIFAGGYSAGYYGYIWSEVLDADSVEWFKENGGLTRANGDHFRKELLSRGGSIDSMQMFRNFRGRDATITPLLTRRGLT